MDIYIDIRKYFTFKKSVYIYTPNFNYLFSCCLIFITSLYILDTNVLDSNGVLGKYFSHMLVNTLLNDVSFVIHKYFSFLRSY